MFVSKYQLLKGWDISQLQYGKANSCLFKNHPSDLTDGTYPKIKVTFRHQPLGNFGEALSSHCSFGLPFLLESHCLRWMLGFRLLWDGLLYNLEMCNLIDGWWCCCCCCCCRCCCSCCIWKLLRSPVRSPGLTSKGRNLILLA